ncbi:MAG: 3-deoxy-7-phosphoheptulonate synthase [bacterium]|nr:3-deoxy-7-phosphoheptulonate synthase [bacterium]
MINLSEIQKLSEIKEYNIPLFSGHAINKDTFTLFAGPCRVESKEQCEIIAESVQKNGAQIFRAGAFKPCTHPHCDWGMGDPGLDILAGIRDQFGIPVITEAMNFQQLERVEKASDIIQIGTRNSQNYELLRELKKTTKPVFYKRGTWMNLREVLAGLEWIVFDEEGQPGNNNVILCERGTVHFNDHMRWTLDYTIVPSVKEYAQVPIVIDISHGTGGKGNTKYYKDLARAAVAVGADGLMVEVHHTPEQSVSDPDQALSLEEFKELVDSIRPVVEAVGKTL